MLAKSVRLTALPVHQPVERNDSKERIAILTIELRFSRSAQYN